MEPKWVSKYLGEVCERKAVFKWWKNPALKKRFVHWGLWKGSFLVFGMVSSVLQHSLFNGWAAESFKGLTDLASFAAVLGYCSYSGKHLKNKNFRPLEVFRKMVLSD